MSDTKRTLRTEKERAEEALAVATRKVTKYAAESKKHGDAKQEADAKLNAARARREFLAKDPALLNGPPAPVDQEGTR